MKKSKRKTQFKFIKLIEGIVLTILIISFGVLVYCIYTSFGMEKVASENNSEYIAKTLNTEDGSKETKNISDIIEKVNDCIVGISKIKNKGSTIFLEDGITSLGLGTGFIVSENGYIVTNEHVSGGTYSTCYVTLKNGKSYTGNVVWADSDIDLSIVKINAGGLIYLQLSDSNNIKIAETVYAIGNPIGFEFQRSVTSGIISGLDRTIKIEEDSTYYMEDLIQTDASINPGNSGGPLINSKGEVIGVNSVKITTAEGIGFATPINIIKPILNSYLNSGEYTQATLGVFAYDKNIIPYINQDLGLNLNLESGIYVAKVVKNSPAYKAGLEEGDIIISIDDVNLSKMRELREYIYSKKPGDEVKIKYLKNNKKYEINVKLVKK